jgi:hypothetical protein
MERIVYILGAGFSAPLGLPVVRNFIFRAKDLYSEAPEGRDHFKNVFEEVRRLSNVKNYFDADLLDIEEILSILDMSAQFEGKSLADDFVRFIQDTILSLTPAPESKVADAVFQVGPWAPYARFVAALTNLVVWDDDSDRDRRFVRAFPAKKPRMRYDVVSLNYDCVLEHAARLVHEAFRATDPVAFSRDPRARETFAHAPALAKLHGSVDNGPIVPPTWRKLVQETMVQQWTMARDVLCRANSIRILGYSLPTTDSYVRYLLKAAASEAPNLKEIDVIVFDPTGSVEARYKSFITFKELRFKNAKLERYFGALNSLGAYSGGEMPPGVRLMTNSRAFNLETVHQGQIRS